MEAPIIIAIVVGICNLVALGFVCRQTYLTSKSVQLSEANLRESQQARAISNLPRAYSIIYVQNCLEGWVKDLKLLVDNEKKLREMVKSSDADIKIDTRRWFGQAKGLIHKTSYNHLPDWLKEILVVGAQYYYEGMCLVDTVCSSKEKKEVRLGLMNDMVERARQGVTQMTKMLAFINKLVPQWYLESPASLNDSDFWDKG